MSTITDIAESKTIIHIQPERSFTKYIISSFVTFLFVGLLIYISRGSAFWTLVTGSVFIFFVSAKLKTFLDKRTTAFNSVGEAIKYLESIDTAKSDNLS